MGGEGIVTGRIVEDAEREWPIWSLSLNEQSAREWLDTHDEDGHDYDDDPEPEEAA